MVYSYEHNGKSDYLGSEESNNFLSCIVTIRFVRRDLSHSINYVKCTWYIFISAVKVLV
jgi:hypothetical protein